MRNFQKGVGNGDEGGIISEKRQATSLCGTQELFGHLTGWPCSWRSFAGTIWWRSRWCTLQLWGQYAERCLCLVSFLKQLVIFDRPLITRNISSLFFKYMIHDTLKSHVWPSFMTHRALYTRLRAGLRDKELEEKQLQLLLSGWKALKSGGYLVYHAWVQRQNNFWPNDWFQNDRNSNDLNSDAGACLTALIASNLVLLFVKVSPSSSRNRRHFHNAVGGVSCSQASDRLYSKPV